MAVTKARQAVAVNSSEAIVRQYYACFNERRLSEAAAMLADTAVLEQVPLRQQRQGSAGHLQFVYGWLSAFPDARFTVQQIASGDGVTYETDLLATGTHLGSLDMGGWIFKPTGSAASLRLRELLEIRHGKIVYSNLSFDLQELVEQLAKIDQAVLLRHTDQIRRLSDDLRAAKGDVMQERRLVDRLGRELDAARHVVRPYFRR
jgi:predicted ester cyclase